MSVLAEEARKVYSETQVLRDAPFKGHQRLWFHLLSNGKRMPFRPAPPPEEGKPAPICHPDDELALCELMHVTRGRLRTKIWPFISRFFPVVNDELTHEMLEQDLAESHARNGPRKHRESRHRDGDETLFSEGSEDAKDGANGASESRSRASTSTAKSTRKPARKSPQVRRTPTPSARAESPSPLRPPSPSPRPPSPNPPISPLPAGLAGASRAREERRRLPAEFSVPQDWIGEGYAARKRDRLPEVDLDAETRRFARHYAAKPDQRTLAEWRLKWLNWCTNPHCGAGRDRDRPDRREPTDLAALGAEIDAQLAGRDVRR
jgi:hypothetical protein